MSINVFLLTIKKKIVNILNLFIKYDIQTMQNGLSLVSDLFWHLSILVEEKILISFA